MNVPSHRDPNYASQLQAINNPVLNPLSNLALSPLNNPRLSEISNPELSPLSNPLLSPLTNPAISPLNNPALSPLTNPRISPISNPRANPDSPYGIDGYYLFTNDYKQDGYALFAQDLLCIVYDQSRSIKGYAIPVSTPMWLVVPRNGGAPTEIWWRVLESVFVRIQSGQVCGLCT